jgi:integrase
MPVTDLNARTWSSLGCLPGRTETTWWARSLKGFGLRCRASGARSWVVQARPLNSCRSLGDANALNYIDAFRRAKHRLSLIRDGETLPGRGDGIPFGELVGHYLTYQQPRLRPSSMRELRRHLTVDARPLHGRRAHQISQRDVVALQQGIAMRAPVTANRVRAGLSAMFTWAMKAGLAKANPVAATFVPSPENARARVLSDKELALIWTFTDDGGSYSRAVRLMLLTGARRQEVGGIREDEITRHADGSATWLLPAARAKNKRPNELLLPPMTAAFLPASRDGHEHLFGRGVDGFTGWTKGRQRLDTRIAVANGGVRIPGWRLHDLRRTLVTRLNDLGIEPHVIEALVNHSSGQARVGVAGVYNKSAYREQKTNALVRWCEHIKEITGAAQADEGTSVAALRRP